VLLAGALYLHGRVVGFAFATQYDYHDITQSVRVMQSGQNPYQPLDVAPGGTSTFGPTHSNYPPTAYVLLAPLPAVAAGVGDVGWIVFNELLVVAVVVVVYMGIGRPSLTEALGVAALVAAFLPVWHNLWWGQVNLVVLLLVVLAMLAHQRGLAIPGGIALGSAVAIKLAPVALIPYFLWKRNWRLAAATVVTLGIVVGVTLLVGWGPRWAQYYDFLGPSGRGTALVNNQTLNGMLLRLWRPDLNGYPIGSPPAGFVPVWYALNILVVGLMLAVLRRIRSGDPLMIWAELAVVLVVLSLVQPIAWFAHHVAAIVAIVVAVRLARQRALPAAAAAGLVVAYVLATPVAAVIGLTVGGSLGADQGHQPALQVATSALVFGAVLAVVCLGAARLNAARAREARLLD
jgi:hypothetical protein